jgi:preprotein translocase subunit SecF
MNHETSTKPYFMTMIPNNLDFDFLKMSKPFVWLSTAIVVISFLLIFTKGLNYGLDFAGGAEVEIKAPTSWTLADVRSTLEKGGIEDATVVQIGTAAESEYLIKIKSTAPDLDKIAQRVETAFASKDQKEGFAIKRSDVVGSLAGEQLRTAAFISLFYAALGIFLYIALRFDLRFAPGIVRALLLDVVVVLGIWVLLGKEFNLNTVAALLTVAGYSCNDTIVIYDRIREFSAQHRDWSLHKIVNRSINLNLGRTVITVLCTLFVVVALWIWGGPILSDFALVMLLGFSVSVFSTIFVANPMIVYMEERRSHHKEPVKA